MTDNVRILRIADLIQNLGTDEPQIAVEPIADADCGFLMYGGVDPAGTTQKWLAKNKRALITTLRLTGPTTTGTTGLLKHDTDGEVTGGKLSIDDLEDLLSEDLPGFSYIARNGGTQWDDYALLYQGSGILLTDSTHGIAIALGVHATRHANGGSDELNVGGLSGLLADKQVAGYLYSLTYPVDLSSAPNVNDFITWDGADWVATSNVLTALTNNQILYGAIDGTIDQSAALVWNDTDLLLDGNIILNNKHIEGVTYVDWIANGILTQERREYWDDDEGYLTITMKGGVVKLQIGGEELLRGYNDSGDTLPNGEAVRVVGATGNRPLLDSVDITSGALCSYAGVMTEQVSDSSFGYANLSGLVRDLNTSSFTAGDKVWKAVGAGYSTSQPAAGNASIMLGYVTRVHATEGVLVHLPHTVPFLDYLSDVNARDTVKDDKAGLIWDDVNSYWDLSTVVTSIEAVGESIGPIAKDIKFYAGTNFYISAVADGFIFSAVAEEIVYTPHTIATSIGDYVSGDVDSVKVPHDDDFYIIDEVSGTPGFSIVSDISGVEGISRIRVYVNYIGSISHTVYIRLYDYTLLTWIDVGSFVGYDSPGAMQYIDLPVEDGARFISVANNARLFLYHTASGVPSHQIQIDYIALVKKGVDTAGGGTLDDAYDFGGDGVGNTIYADVNPVDIIGIGGVTNTLLQLTRADATATNQVFGISDNSANGDSVLLVGSAGGGDDVPGFKLRGLGSTTLLADFTTGGQSYVSLQQRNVESLIHARGIFRAENGVASSYANIILDSLTGYTIDSTAAGSISAATTLTLEGPTFISFADSKLRSILNTAYTSATQNTLTAGVANINLATNTDIQYLDLDANCSEIVLTAPSGDGVRYLIVENTSSVSNYDITNFTNGTTQVGTWLGNYDLNNMSLEVLAEKIIVVKIVYTSVVGYLFWVIEEVD